MLLFDTKPLDVAGSGISGHTDAAPLDTSLGLSQSRLDASLGLSHSRLDEMVDSVLKVKPEAASATLELAGCPVKQLVRIMRRLQSGVAR